LGKGIDPAPAEEIIIFVIIFLGMHQISGRKFRIFLSGIRPDTRHISGIQTKYLLYNSQTSGRKFGLLGDITIIIPKFLN
jgi:hypothetical protein